MTRKVYVVGNQFDIKRMFESVKDYEIIYEPNDADIIVLPGGYDVNPELYGQKKLQGTNINPIDDSRDMKFFDLGKKEGKLLVGICRGGQFLNVANGGLMWQHVNNHTANHLLIDLVEEKTFTVTSTHHQMMRPSEKGEVLAIAKESSTWIDDELNLRSKTPQNRSEECPEFDTEVVWYKDTRSLCFQPHPEFIRAESTKQYFFDLLNMVY